MLYYIVRPLARVFLKATFKKIYIANRELIPLDKPVILAANHPTAFVEPCILACFLPIPLHYVVRGDMFVKPFFAKFLNALHMVPIYRLKDGGFKKLKNNFDTFNYCYDVLKENKTVMIMAEGSTVHEKRLRPLRKGTARIAYGAIKKFPDLDVHIVPVGVNYTYADQARREAMIEIGPPLSAKDYLEQNGYELNRSTVALLKDLRSSLEERMVIIEEEEDERMVEQLFVLYRNQHPEAVFPIEHTNGSRLQTERSIANWVNEMDSMDKITVARQLDRYYADLQKAGIPDLAVAQPGHFNLSMSLFMFIGALPFLLAVLLTFIPFSISKLIVDTKVKSIEFKLSVWLAASLGLFLVYWLTLIVLAFAYGTMIYWTIALLLPFWTYFGVLYREQMQRWKAARKFVSLDKNKRTDLSKQRSALIHLLLGNRNRK